MDTPSRLSFFINIVDAPIVLRKLRRSLRSLSKAWDHHPILGRKLVMEHRLKKHLRCYGCERDLDDWPWPHRDLVCVCLPEYDEETGIITDRSNSLMEVDEDDQ